MTTQVLFVCTANRVRSPLAAALARQLVAAGSLPVEISSAGFLAPGIRADSDMSHVARRRGVDLSAHRSSRVDADLIERSDLVIGMTGEHVVDLVGLSPGSTARILTLREAAAAAPVPRWDPDGVRGWAAGATRRPIAELLDGRSDVADPMGRSMRRYRAAADDIGTLVTAVFATTADQTG